MFVHYRTQGLILKKNDRGEADRIFTVYTKEFGKIEILGKAIRKISSKLRAGMELFSVSEIEFIQGKTFRTLTDAILVEEFKNFGHNLERLKIANKISDVADELILNPEADEKMWELLLKSFQRLDHCLLANKCSLVYYYFLWNFLSLLGYQPELYKCQTCQNKILPGKIFLSIKEEGIICPECSKNIKGKEITTGTIKILRIILERKWNILSKLKLKEEDFNTLELISKDYFLHILRAIK